MCFKAYLNHPINKKTLREKKPKAITVLKKERGGGPARYDHDHRFNGVFFLPLPLINVEAVYKTAPATPGLLKIKCRYQNNLEAFWMLLKSIKTVFQLHLAS